MSVLFLAGLALLVPRIRDHNSKSAKAPLPSAPTPTPASTPSVKPITAVYQERQPAKLPSPQPSSPTTQPSVTVSSTPAPVKELPQKEDNTRAGPKPRKRLPSDAMFIPTEHPEIKQTASSLGSLEDSYRDRVRDAVQKGMDEAQGTTVLSAEGRTSHTLRIRCDTRNAELLLLPMKEGLSPELLQRLENAVEASSGRFPCPYEIRDQYGLYYEFPMEIFLR